MKKLKSADPNERKGGCLRYGATAFFALGIVVYSSMAVTPQTAEVVELRPLLIGMSVLFGFFIWLLWRPRNKQRAHSSTDNNIANGADKTQAKAAIFDKRTVADLFKAKENQTLKDRISQLEAMLTPELQDMEAVKGKISALNQELLNKQDEMQKLDSEIADLQQKISQSKAELIETDEEVMLQSFGLYTPKYEFASAESYKNRLAEVRTAQKMMIKAGTAAHGASNWLVNGSKSDGNKMVKDMQKLLLRSFNSECDEAISKVKFNTFDTAQKRITASRDAISKLGRMMNVSIANEYYLLKIDELHLALEYQIKKQDEKEEQKRIRAELREQAKLQKEIEEARRNISKEQHHYQNALTRVLKQLENASGAEADALQLKRREIETQLEELKKALEQVDYREANQKAGYVYIISNVGSFGENVYKIGMTRRLDPMDRVDELGDASVPFNFDVHAMIFSENAPQLEAALHNAFSDRKLNMVNTRREFFRVSLDEIEQVVKQNYDKTVEFVKLAPAQQYRESLLIRQQIK